MDLLVLDTNLVPISILDTFESLIWVDRYTEYGDFELFVKASEEIIDLLKSDYYLICKESEHVMIVEDIKINSDAENGDYIPITGRSLESIIDRRIVWSQTILSGNLQNGIQKLLNENVISPTIPERAIPNFIFEASDDPNITSLTIDAQFTGDNLYKAIKSICDSNNIGFKVTLSENNLFVFKLYSGTDRSYNQLTNPYVIFSPKFDNIISSNYSESKKDLKTLTLVAGEGEGTERKTIAVGGGESLNRREMYTDARDLSQTVDEELLTDEEYLLQLSQRGLSDLLDHGIINSFEGQVDSSYMFKYGEDFFIGDIVQFESNYNINAKARVVEVIHSQSTSGIDIYPTFKIIESEED